MNVQRQIDQLIAERASEWVEKLRQGKKETYPEFIRWVGESPRHLREFMAILALREELPGAFARAGIDREALLRRVSANADALTLPTRGALSLPAKERSWWRQTKVWAAATALVVTLGSALWILRAQGSQTFATAVGEQRTVTLADGSLMSLNAHSKARVKFKDHLRDIELVDGEALFQVAHDSQRPFRVHTKDAVVQAVGTRFNVNARPTRTVVSVFEGKVEVSAETSPQMSERQPLSAGEAAEVTREGKVQRRPSEEANSAAAWRQRQLVFAKTPLEDVAADFNRFHEKGRLVLEDMEPGSHHYTGTFNADDVASFAAMLAREPDLSVETRDGNYIVQRKKPAHLGAH